MSVSVVKTVGAAFLLLAVLLSAACSGRAGPGSDVAVIRMVDAHDAFTEQLLRTYTWAHQAELAAGDPGPGVTPIPVAEVRMMGRSLEAARSLEASLEVPAADVSLLRTRRTEIRRMLEAADAHSRNAQSLTGESDPDPAAIAREARAVKNAARRTAITHASLLSMIDDPRARFLPFSPVVPRYEAAAGYRLALNGIDRMLGYGGPGWGPVWEREARLATERVRIVDGAVGAVAAGQTIDTSEYTDRLSARGARAVRDLSGIQQSGGALGEARVAAEDARQQLQSAEDTYRGMIKHLSLRYPEFSVDEP